MSDDNSPGFRTRSLHTGQSPDGAAGARIPPLYQTTPYVFDDTADTAAQFALGKPGHIYSRLIGPTVGTLQKRLASLEGDVGAITTSSGMAAFDLATFLLASASDNIISASLLYGGTYTYLTHTVERRSITTRLVGTLDVDAYEATINDNTAFVHLEAIDNPMLMTPDIEAIVEVAHDHGMSLFVDNTFATPYLCNPIERDAGLVWESTTKWIRKTGTTIGDTLVGGGSFLRDEYTDDHPEIIRPGPAYHGVNFDETFGPAGFAYAAIVRGLCDLGSAQSPFDAWQTLEELESLPLRMHAHYESAQTVVEFLDNHEKVLQVSYPSLDSHETYEGASKYLGGDYDGMITFGLTDDYKVTKDTISNVELASLLANVGDAKTLVIHPASTTHRQLTDDEQAAAGVTPDMVRLSVGIEDVDDIIDDLGQAIHAASN